MEEDDITIQKASAADFEGIMRLYKKVSRHVGGLARIEPEITRQYVENFMLKAARQGVQLVAVDRQNNDQIVGEIHCYTLEPQVFRHVFSELTIAIDTDYQGKGLGKKLFQALLDYISTARKDILRVELIARSSNQKAIQLYEKLGFRQEGRLENRIYSEQTGFEADIPMAWMNPEYVRAKP